MGSYCLAFAVFQGAVVAWWLRVMDGTTLRQSHRDWSAGPGFNLWYAILTYRTTGLLASGTICAAVIFADGILIKSATIVIQGGINETLLLDVTLAPELPTDFCGSMSVNSSKPVNFGTWNNASVRVIDGWMKASPTSSPFRGCGGICTTNVTAATLYPVGCTAPDSGYIAKAHFKTTPFIDLQSALSTLAHF